ncbi:adipocyte plasma membrane-associated protein-like [Oppia nitens]|uniref:adipocyte plasma membrane-associated protein-like n=1 Tax=Oppia nitens TaxID=1686743 RepID=UPI0023DB7BF2|nr:adipocyte plasma membrane-associated protein-like [Oppia nitens]
MIKLMFKIALYFGVFIALILILPANILLDIDPKPRDRQLPEEFVGPFKANDALTQSSVILKNQIVGPESIAQFNGRLITGAEDGYLYEVNDNNVKRLLRLSEKSCYQINPYNRSKCSRPAGMRFDSKGTLYVVDPNIGVFLVKNIFTKTPKVELVFDIEDTKALGGQSSKFFNDVAIDEGAGLNGGHVLYVSDISVRFDFFEMMFTVFGSDTGRIVKYDINARKVESVVKDILLPNGPKKGESAILADLPGEPDNIRRSVDTKCETYWVALGSARTASKPSNIDFYMDRPLMRKFLCRFTHLLGSAITSVGDILNVSALQEFGSYFKSGFILGAILFKDSSRNYGMIVEIDINGNIIQTLHGNHEIYTLLSEVREVRINDKQSVLYIGSFINDYILKLTYIR